MAADETSIAGGRLLNTQTVQEGVDDVGKQLKNLADQIKALASLTKATYAPGSAAAAAVPMGYGKPLGGGVTFNGQPALSASQQRGAAQLPAGTPLGGTPQAGAPTQAAPSTPNGGGFSFSALRSSPVAVSAAAGVGALVSYGNRTMADQATMEYTSRFYAANGGYSFGSVNQSLFANKYYGQSTADIATGASALAGAQGYGVMSSQFQTLYGQLGGYAAADPTRSFASQISGYNQMTSSQGYWGLTKYGIQTIGKGGRSLPPTAIYNQISRMVGIGPNHKWTANQVNGVLMNQNSGLNLTVQGMVQNGTLSQDAADNYLSALRTQALASQTGMSTKQVSSLLTQYGQGNKAAGDQLKAAGVTNLDTMVSSMQQTAGVQRNRQVDQTEAFAQGVKDANKAVQQFSQAITNFLKATGLNKAIGYGSGAASTAWNAASGTVSTIGGVIGGNLLTKGAGKLLGKGLDLFKGGAPGVTSGAEAATTGEVAAGGEAAAGGGGFLSSIGGLFTGAAALTTGLVAAAGASVGAAIGRTTGALRQRHANNEYAAIYGNLPTPMEWKAGKHNGYTLAQVNYLWKNYSKIQAAQAADNHANNTDSVAHSVFYGNTSSHTQTAMNQIVAGAPGTLPNIGGGGGGGGQGYGAGSNNASSGHANINGNDIVQYAMKFIGVPYVYGGESPTGFDCSGLVQYVFKHFGVPLPRLANQQATCGTAVPLSKAEPGDLVAFHISSDGPGVGHIGIYVGNGKVINAPHTGANVRIEPIATMGGPVVAVRRVVGAGSGSFNAGGGGNGSGASAAAGYGPGGTSMGAGSGDSLLGGSSEAATIAAALGNMAGGAAMSSASGSKTGAGAYSARSGTGGVGNVKAVGGSPSANEKLGRQMAASMYGWTGSQANALDQIWTQESGWSASALNKGSGAYGIPQALPGNKMASAGADWRTNPATQIKWGLKYIKERYGDPLTALQHEHQFNWYDRGAWDIGADQKAVLHKGEMVIPAAQADTIRKALLQHNLGPDTVRRGTGGGGVQIIFADGAIRIESAGSEKEARRFGRQVVDAITSDSRIKQLQAGH